VQTIIVPRCLGGGVPAPRLLALEERLAEPLVIHAGADRLLEADVYRAD
jgi:hypothetical protein